MKATKETALTFKERIKAFLAIAKMAFRNLSRHKKATFLLGGVIGFGVLIISLMQGCAGAVMGNVSENVANLAAGHIYITGVEKLASGKEFSIIRDDSVLFEALEASGLQPTYVSRRAEIHGTLIFETNSTIQNVSGVDFSKETYLTERLVLTAGSLDDLDQENALVISDKMAEDLNVEVGYKILVQLQTFSRNSRIWASS